MSGKIFSDKTLDAALERASTDLNVAVEELDYSIVESNLEEGVFSILVEDAQGKKTNFSKNNNRGEIKETIKKQEPVPVDETPVNVEDVKEIIDGFLEKITLEIKASYTEIDDKNLEADLQGEDSKVLSENNMELLNTVEFLINRMVNKKVFDSELPFIKKLKNDNIRRS